MSKLLIPVDDSPSCRHALRHVIQQARAGEAMELHLLNVQRPFHAHIGQYFSPTDLDEAHAEASQQSSAAACRLLDEAGLAYSLHRAVGEQAQQIAAHADRLGCSGILMGTARKSAVLRALESSVTSRVIELTHVPVTVIAGDSPGKAERYGLPAAISAGLALIAAESL